MLDQTKLIIKLVNKINKFILLKTHKVCQKHQKLIINSIWILIMINKRKEKKAIKSNL